MATILTINTRTKAFDSTLPEGVVGDVAHLDLLTIEHVATIEVERVRTYEGNIDGEFIVELKNGDIIRIAGYNALWELMHYDKLNQSAQVDVLDDFRDWADSLINN